MERIAAAAWGAGLPLSTLAAETATLESVFQELTSAQHDPAGDAVPEPEPVVATEGGAR
jgi:hypothetical protein